MGGPNLFGPSFPLVAIQRIHQIVIVKKRINQIINATIPIMAAAIKNGNNRINNSIYIKIIINCHPSQ